MYEIYDKDGVNKIAQLFHIKKDGYQGYVILDLNNMVVEFSKGKSAYDIYKEHELADNCKALSYNGLPAIESNNCKYVLNYNGEIIYNLNENNNFDGEYSLFKYRGHKQTISCIPGSIANYMWFQDKYRGFSSLVANNQRFSDVESEINSILIHYGGRKNSNIPKTVVRYVKSKNRHYIVRAKNVYNQSFYNVRNIISNKNYCLLGFSAGSGYDDKVGHMTLCIGTYSRKGKNFVELLDGHNTEVVSTVWSDKYNDYLCDIHLRR